MPPDLKPPPDWSLQVGSLGSVLVAAALLAFVLAGILALLNQKKWSNISFSVGCCAVFGSFITLGVLFVQNRFEFAYVNAHSELASALQYRIASIWSGQEGSFLLWSTTSSIFGLIVLRKTGALNKWFTVTYATFLACLTAISIYETPFRLIEKFEGRLVVPPDGQGLNPTLQNYWIVIHPPTIFMGFGSLTVLFALAVAGLITMKHKEWLQVVRPFAILSLSLIGVGLCMGGFWAYETLGWGGFWMWDPVENVSFVPWVICAALVHGLIVQSTREKWIGTNLFLSGLAFLSFVYGTYLTRAGQLDGVSVHSFASMQETAHIVLLRLLQVSSLGFVALVVWRWKSFPRKPSPSGIVRDKAYAAALVLLCAFGAAAAIGMSVPLLQSMRGEKPKVVEEHLYHLVVSWFFVPTLLLMAIGPFVTWKTIGLKALFARLSGVLSITMGLVGLTMLVMANPDHGIRADLTATISIFGGIKVPTLPFIISLFALCVFSIVGNLWRIAELRRSSKLGWGPFIAHLGVAILMAGLIVSRGFERKQQVYVQDGNAAQALGYIIQYKGKTKEFTDRTNQIRFEVTGPDSKFEATPGFYFMSRMSADGSPELLPNARPYIEHSWSHDLYMAIGAPILTASEEMKIAPGESKKFSVDIVSSQEKVDLPVKYVKMTRVGEAGQLGTKFEAELLFELPEGPIVVKPSIEISKGDVHRNPAMINDQYYVNVFSMDAGTKAVNIQVGFMRPVYPIELFYKPLTSFVWLGTALMTLGGLMSSFNRRNRKPSNTQENQTGTKSVEEHEDALVPAP